MNPRAGTLNPPALKGVLWGDLAGPATLAYPRDNVDGPRARLEPQVHGDVKIVMPAVPASDIAGELPVGAALA